MKATTRAAVTSASAPDAQARVLNSAVQAKRHVHDLADVRLVVHQQNANVGHTTSLDALVARDARRSRTVATRLSIDVCDLASAAWYLRIRRQVRAVGGKNDHGNYIALAVAQLGQQIGAGPFGERHVKHRKVEVAGLQRALRLLDRIDRNDIANFAERARDGVVFVDVKDSRPSVRLMREGLGEQP